MKLIYAELIEEPEERGGSWIKDRGVFISIEEFLPYRVLGWSGTKETDELADAILERINDDK